MSKLKISADTTPVKKSLLELSQEVKKIGGTGSKVSIFTEKERRFFKKELNAELGLMKTKLKDNRKEIAKLVGEAQKLERGSKEELKIRKEINQAYKTQARLGKQIGQLETSKKGLGGFGGIGGKGGGGMGAVMGGLGRLAGGAALALGAGALVRGSQAASQYQQGVPDRVRLKGLGVQGDNFGSPMELAQAGMTEQEMIQRRVQATSLLGRDAGSNQNMMNQAKFERSFGLEDGQMTNIAGSLRAQFGGSGANEAQMKLQASVLASGMEDAIGPYLETATQLLSQINENGMTNTSALVNAIGVLSASGYRNPEQIAKTFSTINDGIKGASGESNAFLQTAFAKKGIGGGTIGGTRFAMETGGLFGLDQSKFQELGFNNPALTKQMRGAGLFGGLGNRASAVMSQLRESVGIGAGQGPEDIKDPDKLFALQRLSNNVFGTEGTGGLEAFSQLSQVEEGKLSQKDFEKKLKDLQEGKDPAVDRMNKINTSLAGQTDIIAKNHTNLMEQLGTTTVKITNKLTDIESAILANGGNAAAEGVTDTLGAGTLVGAAGGAATGAAIGSVVPILGTALGALLGGAIGGGIGYFTGDRGVSKEGNVPSSNGSGGISGANRVPDSDALLQEMRANTKAVMEARKATIKNVNNNKTNVFVDGKKVNSRTHK